MSFTSDNGPNYLLAGKLLEPQDEYDDMENDIMEWPEHVELGHGDFSIQSVRCAAHTLQLAVDDAMKRTDGCKEILVDARQLVNFLN